MEVLAQWSDDVAYRRNVDYSAVNCSGMDSSCKMDLGGPNSGGSKSVHFNENDASDSVIWMLGLEGCGGGVWVCVGGGEGVGCCVDCMCMYRGIAVGANELVCVSVALTCGFVMCAGIRRGNCRQRSRGLMSRQVDRQ